LANGKEIINEAEKQAFFPFNSCCCFKLPWRQIGSRSTPCRDNSFAEILVSERGGTNGRSLRLKEATIVSGLDTSADIDAGLSPLQESPGTTVSKCRDTLSVLEEKGQIVNVQCKVCGAGRVKLAAVLAVHALVLTMITITTCVVVLLVNIHSNGMRNINYYKETTLCITTILILIVTERFKRPTLYPYLAAQSF